MTARILSREKEDHVLAVDLRTTANTPEKIGQLSDELFDLGQEVIQDDEIWVVLFTGTKENSLALFGDWVGSALKANKKKAAQLRSIAEPVAKIDRPVVAAIQGDAIGQGLELALACDLRIAGETSHFGLPMIEAGLIPWDGGTQRLSRLVGRGRALEMILTGRIIDAKEAQRIGLVNRIVPPAGLLTAARGIAREMAAKGPIALRYAKEAVQKGMDLTLGQGLRLEADLYFLLHTSRDRTEGVQAFREKRTPHFRGE
jgi:enoyl-CoA hydratase/carnithine racemase